MRDLAAAENLNTYQPLVNGGSSPRDSDVCESGGVAAPGGGESTLESDEGTAYASRQNFAGTLLESQLQHKLSIGCNVEKESVYGLAIALPQIARSAGWSAVLTGLAIRGWFFMFVTYFLQGLFMYMMFKEQNVMERFSGQMNLCDFGAHIEHCHEHDDALGCLGPAGTRYSASRLYSWPQWADRVFVKESLQTLFPSKHDEIEEKIDPGEYGLEDYWCRLAAVFVFMISVVEELLILVRLIKLLWLVPTKSESWILYMGSMDDSSAAKFEHISLRVSGIPLVWKVIYIVLILLPRAVMWKFVAECGMTFLMESAGITEVIVNCVALGFVLGLGTMIASEFTARATKDLMESLKNFHPEGHADEKSDSVGKVSGYTHSTEVRFGLFWKLLPLRFISTLVITGILVLDYYRRRCTQSDGGTWISKSVFLPKSLRYSIWTAVLPRLFPLAEEDHPYWTMPDAK